MKTSLDSLLPRVGMPSWKRFGGFNLIPDGDGGGSGGGAGGGEGGDKGGQRQQQPPPADTIPRSEAQKAFRERDRAKAIFRATIKALGHDPDEVEIEETGDKDNPFRIKGLEGDIELLNEGRQKRRANVKWEDRETELNNKHQQKTQSLVEKHGKETRLRDNYIREMSVIPEIRLSCQAEKAIDDDNSGNFDDIVSLLAPRVRVETATEGEGDEQKLVVKKTVLAEDGTPLLDSKGKPAGIRQLVSEFLAKRPKYRQSSFRNGPGAGGYGNGSGQGITTGQNGNGNGQQKSPAAFMFGR